METIGRLFGLAKVILRYYKILSIKLVNPETGTTMETSQKNKELQWRLTQKRNYNGDYRQTPIWEFPKIRGTLFRGPYNKDPTIYDAILGSPIFGNRPCVISFGILSEAIVAASRVDSAAKAMGGRRV